MDTKADWEKIFIIARDLQNAVKRTPLQEEITIAQERIISYVFSEDGIMQSRLVKLLNNTPATVSVAVESLVKKGLLKRIPKEDDRRIIILKPTEKGEEMKEKFKDFFDGKMNDLLRELSEEEKKTFSSILTKLAEKSTQIHIHNTKKG